MIKSPAEAGTEAIIEHNKAAYERVLFRFWGGDGEDDDDDDDADDVDKDEDDDDDDEDDEDDDEEEDVDKKPKAKRKPAAKDDDDDDDEDDDDDDGDTAKELARLKRENIRLKKAQDKKDEDAKTEKDKDKRIRSLEKRAGRAERLVRTSYIETAIAKQKKYEFIDVEDVRKALDMDAIDIDMDSGDIDGLDLELKRIAKKKPHWLKSDDDDEEPAPGRRRPPPQQRRQSGGHPYGTRNRREGLDKDAIARKYKIPGISGVTA